jgi:hypothetical protein
LHVLLTLRIEEMRNLLGAANRIDLKKSAGHSTNTHSAKYRKDAVDLCRMNKENPTLANPT